MDCHHDVKVEFHTRHEAITIQSYKVSGVWNGFLR